MIVNKDCLEWLPTVDSSNKNVVLSDPDWSLTRFPWARFLKECIRVTDGGSTVLVWSASPEILKRLLDAAEDASYTVKHIFAWYKPNGSQPTGWGISRRWEAVVWMDNLPGRRGELKYISDVWTIPRVTSVMLADAGHVWQKPVGLCDMLVRGFSIPGDTAIDPFCGSGSILFEAQFQQRKVLGCDIDPIWAEYTLAGLEGRPLKRPGDLF